MVINDYMRYQKERALRKEISESTVPNYYKPIKLFLEMNDIVLNWKKIARRIPRGSGHADDRAPSKDEMRRILTYPDRRIKPIVLIMASSGIRVGAWDYLNLEDVVPVEREGRVVAARLTVYRGTDDEYETFISPEAYKALQEYIEFRRSSGERIGAKSPVVRDLFYPDRGAKGEPHIPKRLKSSGVKRLIEEALKGTGVRMQLEKGKRRYEFQADHGFRKFFKSACERHMKTLHVEMLMGHDVGLSASYYRPSEDELLASYIRALKDLVISEEEELRRELTKNIVVSDRKIGELERYSIKLQERLEKIEKDYNELRRLIEEGAGSGLRQQRR
jgi:integrase